ncbi:phage head protein [Serinicoccus sediminis]|uniref:phage major capsid protein n=1 Tax=Serinicoccus sediminis TaxID=2306021 RepID=UPI00101FC3CF|nr:phage head protein [Serinicoccus sediminis]
MATTLSTDLYTPEVWADLSQSKFAGKAIVATSPAVLVDDQLVGQPGDTVNFPKWMNMSEMQDLAETDVLVPEKLKQSNSQATIKEAGKAAEWSDKAKLTGIGNVQDEAIRQFGILSARKVDADLIAAATAVVAGGITYADGTAATSSAPLSLTATGGLTWANIVKAGLLFGDDFDPTEFAGLYIPSVASEVMLNDDKFIQAAQTAQGNSLINTGLLGTKNGLRVFMTNRLANNKAVLLKNNSLGLMYKRRPIVEQDRDILARTTVVATNMHYAVKRLADDGVVDITLAAGA